MKLLFITDLFPIRSNPQGGIFVIQRLKVLRRMGIDFEIYSTYCKEDAFLKFVRRIFKRNYQPIQRVHDIDFLSLPCRINLADILRITIMKKSPASISEVPREHDLVHAHGMYGILPAGLVAKILSERLRVPYVVTLHGSDVNRNMPRKRDLFLEVLENASAVIFVSSALRERAVSLGYSGRNAVVIPNGYDPDIFYPVDKELVRKELGVYREGYKYVGFVGNLVRVKRADRLPEIFDIVAKRMKKTFFIIVGDGPFRKKIERKMRRRNLEFVMTGKLEQREVARWMNAMDVMVLPSRSEGWPCVVLEAQACGTAVVGSDRGGIPEAVGFREFIVEDGENFEERFAERVTEILVEGYKKESLLERVRDFTWGNVVKRELEIYNSVLGGVM